jgi:hypothetical protein
MHNNKNISADFWLGILLSARGDPGIIRVKWHIKLRSNQQQHYAVKDISLELALIFSTFLIEHIDRKFGDIDASHDPSCREQ